MKVSPLAGKPAPPAMLVDVPRLVSAYSTEVPDPAIPGQQVAFGTSGHRGSALQKTFNEWHVLAITQAICRHRAQRGVDGPLFLGIDMEAIRGASIRVGVDPLGGAGVHYWTAIAERYGLNLTVVSETVDPTFGFMTVDWDGRIRMDPSSSYAMQRLIGLKDRFDIAVACDTDHDRHGIVTRSSGLLPPNHYLAVAIHHLFLHRPQWRAGAGVGKTVVSSGMIDRVSAKLGRRLFEVPVGFKWFVDGLLDGSLGFGGEESAGASFLRRDGTVWTTDKDGIVPALLAAEITARAGRDPGEIYRELTRQFGERPTTGSRRPPVRRRSSGYRRCRRSRCAARTSPARPCYASSATLPATTRRSAE